MRVAGKRVAIEFDRHVDGPLGRGIAWWSIGAPVVGAKIQGHELSEREFVEGRLIVGTTAQRPAEQALALADRQVVDAGDARVHQAVRVEFPVLVAVAAEPGAMLRSEEHTSELQSLMRISYAVFCLKKQNTQYHTTPTNIKSSQPNHK